MIAVVNETKELILESFLKGWDENEGFVTTVSAVQTEEPMTYADSFDIDGSLYTPSEFVDHLLAATVREGNSAGRAFSKLGCPSLISSSLVRVTTLQAQESRRQHGSETIVSEMIEIPNKGPVNLSIRVTNPDGRARKNGKKLFPLVKVVWMLCCKFGQM